MNSTSIIAIYILFWVLSAFLVLPFGVKTHDELGLEKTPGQADSAPANFRPLRVILHTTLLSAALFALYYANYVYGWIDRNSFDFLIKGPGAA
jgi:predicted secreted protein